MEDVFINFWVILKNHYRTKDSEIQSLTTRGITKEFPRNTPILSPGEFPFLKDSRGIPWESIEYSFLVPGNFFAKKVELLRNFPGIPYGTKEVHKWNSN
jgi:hypothetical protein